MSIIINISEAKTQLDELLTLAIQGTEVSLTNVQPKKREYKVQALKDLLENAPPTPPDFDSTRAKWEYLKEKHNL